MAHQVNVRPIVAHTRLRIRRTISIIRSGMVHIIVAAGVWVPFQRAIVVFPRERYSGTVVAFKNSEVYEVGRLRKMRWDIILISDADPVCVTRVAPVKR